jgi:hypothetical protein
MKRAYAIYAIVTAILIAGLWAILTFGSALEAPPDLSGTWQTKWDSPPPFASPRGEMNVQQSGRFLSISFDSSPPMSFTLDRDQIRELRNPVRRMRNETWTLTMTGNPLLAEVRVDLDGPSHYAAAATSPKMNRPTTANAH